MSIEGNRGNAFNIPRQEESEPVLEVENIPESGEVKVCLEEGMRTEDNPEVTVERFQPIRENPIEKIIIGLQHTLGSFEHPTRVRVIFKDGRVGDMAWEKAESLLPPEFGIVRKLGEQARQIEKEANDLMNSIRGGTDVMERSGHIKDALLKPLGVKRPALKYLDIVGELEREIDEIAQQSFLELRRMANDGGAQESHAENIQKLFSHLDLCQNKLKKVRTEVFQQLPKVNEKYDQVFRHREGKSMFEK